MFEPDAKGVAECKKLAEVNPVIGRVEKKTFRSWVWNEKYDAIFHTWSTGYLSDSDLVVWLKKAKGHLNNKQNTKSSPKCFIYVLDNVSDSPNSFLDNGQINRPIHAFTPLFKKANLEVKWESKPQKLHKEYGKQKLWVLY